MEPDEVGWLTVPANDRHLASDAGPNRLVTAL